MREQDIPYFFEGLQKICFLEQKQSVIVVGDYPLLPNFSLVEPMQNKTFPKTAKQYVHKSGLNIFAFPNVMVLGKLFQYHFEATENSFIIAIVKNYADYFLIDFFARTQQYYHSLVEIKFICIPPDKENYKILSDFLLAHKQNRCGLPKTTKFILSEEQKIAFIQSNKTNDVPYSWQDWKELGKHVISCRPGPANEHFIYFYRISHSKLKDLYERFDGTLDTLISYRQELAKLCTNLSKFEYDLVAFHKRSSSTGFAGIKSFFLALEASRWNPKWSKSYYRMKKASKLEFHRAYDVNARDPMFHTLEQESRASFYNWLTCFLSSKNLNTENLNEEIDRILNNKGGDLIYYRKLFSEYEFNAVRMLHHSEIYENYFNIHHWLLHAKFMNPGNHYSIFLKEYLENLNARANKREVLFKKFQEDKILRDLVLFDIGYNLCAKLNKNPIQ